MEHTDIKKYLDRGDYIKIARIAGYENLKNGRQYVYQVLSGRVPNTTNKTGKIIQAAEDIANQNQLHGKLPNSSEL